MKKIAKETAKTIKGLSKLAWVAAVIIPGGFIAIGVYTAIQVYRGNNDRSKYRRRQHR